MAATWCLAPSSETSLLKTELFIAANQRGDGGSALENARLGRILGFDTFMDQNVNAILPGNADTAAGTVTGALAAGGSGSQGITMVGNVTLVGEYATRRRGRPAQQRSPQPPSMVATPRRSPSNAANKYATGAAAVIVVYKKCDVNGGYAAGYSQAILVDGWTATKAPAGRAVDLVRNRAGSRHTYTIIESYLSSAGVQAPLLGSPVGQALDQRRPWRSPGPPAPSTSPSTVTPWPWSAGLWPCRTSRWASTRAWSRTTGSRCGSPCSMTSRPRGPWSTWTSWPAWRFSTRNLCVVMLG